MLQAVLNTRSGLVSAADYRKYRAHAGRRAAALRKRAGLATRPSRTASPRPRAADQPAHWQIELWLAERAWAAGREMRAALDANDSSALRRAAKTRLAKAEKHAQRAVDLASGLSSTADAGADPAPAALTPDERLGLLVFAALVAGDHAAAQHSWGRLVELNAQARVGLEVLGRRNPAAAAVYSDTIASTVDPALRYSLARSGRARRADVPRVARQLVAASEAPLAALVAELDPAALRVDAAADPAQQLGVLQWRSHTASVADADLAQLILSARALEDKLDVSAGPTAFDALLLAWQEAADLVHEIIVAAETRAGSRGGAADDATGADQANYIVATYIDYQVLWRRIQRDSLLEQALTKGEGSKADGVAGGDVLAVLRDIVRLLDTILQSCDEMAELRGVFSDEELAQSIEAMKAYFGARRSAALAQAHQQNDQHAAALALIVAAIARLEAAPTLTAELPVAGADVVALSRELAQARVRAHGLAAVTSGFETDAEESAQSSDVYIAEDLTRYPRGSPTAVLSHLANVRPQPRAVPVKPVFYDIAYNYVGADVVREDAVATPKAPATLEATPAAPQTPPAGDARKRSLFGLFKGN